MPDDGENFFKYMKSIETATFKNIIETECLWYCFLTILQNDFNSAKDHWNTHRVRNSRFQTIHGRPNALYEISSRSRGQEFLKLTISNEMFNQTAASVTEEEHPDDYQGYFSYLMEVLERQQPGTWQEALSFFIELKRMINFQDYHFLSTIHAALRSKKKC